MNLASPSSTSRTYPGLALFQRPARRQRIHTGLDAERDGGDGDGDGDDLDGKKTPQPLLDPEPDPVWHDRIELRRMDTARNDPPSTPSASALPPTPPPTPTCRWWPRVTSFLRTQLKYIGPGASMSVAYCDPGNWATDLSAGSQFGYSLLFVVALTGAFGIVLQVLSARLGIVRGKDLAVVTREWVMGLGRGVQSEGEGEGEGEGDALSLSRHSWHPHSRPQSDTRRSRAAHHARHALLWTLYLVAEGAIVCTELAELVGSAIALNLLFPALPLFAGVLITSLDVFLILFIYRPDTRSLRTFEACVGVLILVVISCLVALVVKVDPHWPSVFEGYLPSSTVVQPKPLYVSIGILGATVMPHGLFLGSHFAMFERDGQLERSSQGSQGSEAGHDDLEAAKQGSGRGDISPLDATTPTTPDAPAHDNTTNNNSNGTLRAIQDFLARNVPGVDRSALGLQPTDARLDTTNKPDDDDGDDGDDGALSAPSAPPPSPRAIKSRILHTTLDITLSMLAFALTTNSALLVIAAQAFYYGIGGQGGAHGGVEIGDLFQAFDLLKEKLSRASAILFAIALLAAGQSASLTVTLSGQIISEGMIHWRTNPFIRRCITRGITLVPSLAVAAAVGRSGLDTMLVASQVALSVALPFVLLPLLVVTGSRAWMTVPVPVPERGEAQGEDTAQHTHSTARTSTTRTPKPSPLAPLAGLLRRQRTLWTRQWGREVSAPSPSPSPSQGTGWGSGSGSGSATAAMTASPATVVSFASGWLMVGFTVALYGLIVLADGYVIVTTAMGIGE